MTSTPSAPLSHGHRPGSARAALAYPDFRRMWMASFSSSIGTWMQNVVLPLYVLDRTDSASMVGLMVFAQLGPLLFLSIPAGVIADRFDRRKWLIAMQLLQLAFSALLAPLAAADAPIWAIFLVALGVGMGNALNAPAWSAMLPTLVDRDDIAGSVSLNSAMINGSRVVGPIIVAVLRSSGVSISQIFLINAVTYLFVVGALLRTRVPAPVKVVHAPGWRQLTAGVQIAKANPAVWRLLVTLFTFSLLSLPYVGLFAAVVRLNFGVDKGSTTYEWLYATWGFGACFGGLAIGTVFVGWDKRSVIRYGFLAFAIALAAFAAVREPVGAFVVAPLLGFAYFATTTSMNTVLQSRLEDHERGRVMSLWFMAFGGTVPLGNLVFAPVIDAVGARWVLLGGALWALFLAWWCDIERIDLSAEEGRRYPLEPDHAACFDEHGVSAGE
ncbi:MAG: MFS transporter [Actinobacteria bacterium]|nr:MFS transporter [Acidimicrobiaceae bacterium]MBP6488857.1 MFS transporter [Ilumatobacteraceae bacterium]NMD22744.1 MFS transporter [Actinomycetota bacterium]MBP7890435.1 MFS transporter [Ilumatobacteraceae bacterium]MBP8211816.1 MFS transporter [Ilumatobacteraceae bacterium]